MKRFCLFPLLALLLAACGNAPPVPAWQLDARGSADRALQAYLSGDARVADVEWARVRADVARTGQPALAARVELLRCAAQVASLQEQPCTGFDALRQDAGGEAAAYADYLAGHLEAARVPLLPPAQRAPALDVTAVAQVEDPLSRLVAAGAALRAGRATPETLVLATQTASAQGWRRPLLAWLLLREQRARATGDAALADALARRIRLVQSSGAAVAQ